MNILSILGAFIITLALLAYGIGSVTLERFKIVNAVSLIFLTVGVLLDGTAIVLMSVVSRKSGMSVHAVVGFLAYLVMLTDTIAVWRLYMKDGLDSPVNNKVLKYNKIAYVVWILAYITGSSLVLWR